MHRDKRQILVDKATELFSEHGFQAVGVDWIIRDSDVARMTLYRHFAGKDELIREVLLQRHQYVFQSIARKMQPITDPKGRVKCIFDWYRSWFGSAEFAGCLFERALAEFGTKRPLISEAAVLFRNSMTDLMTGILQDLVPPAAAKHLGHVLMMLLDGATLEARATNAARSAAVAWVTAEKLIDHEISNQRTRPKKPREAVSV
ncbi:MAG TPA: TetR/AcrR family transcriptional regulator [Steroidobacteraceae bacterium]